MRLHRAAVRRGAWGKTRRLIKAEVLAFEACSGYRDRHGLCVLLQEGALAACGAFQGCLVFKVLIAVYASGAEGRQCTDFGRVSPSELCHRIQNRDWFENWCLRQGRGSDVVDRGCRDGRLVVLVMHHRLD